MMFTEYFIVIGSNMSIIIFQTLYRAIIDQKITAFDKEILKQ